MEGFLIHTWLFPTQQVSSLPEFYSIVRFSPENSEGRNTSVSAFSLHRQRGACSNPILLQECLLEQREQGWLAWWICCCNAHKAAAWLQTPQALGPIQECFCFPFYLDVCQLCYHSRLWGDQDWYLQFTDKQVYPFLAHFPEQLICLEEAEIYPWSMFLQPLVWIKALSYAVVWFHV